MTSGIEPEGATRLHNLRPDEAGDGGFLSARGLEGGISCGVRWRGVCGVWWRSDLGDGGAGRPENDAPFAD
jgi:hypothetical protein